jgi:hypothetical protein
MREEEGVEELFFTFKFEHHTFFPIITYREVRIKDFKCPPDRYASIHQCSHGTIRVNPLINENEEFYRCVVVGAV